MVATLSSEGLQEVERIAAHVRAYAAEWALRANGGYLAQACGTAELFALLHTQILDLGPSQAPTTPPRFHQTPSPGDPGVRGEDWLGSGPDTLIVSPAHYATAHYATLVATGRLDAEALVEHSTDGGLLEMIGAEHSPGMAVTSGSLGIALGVAVGRAIARKQQGKPGSVWVLISDGELQEGSTWEALQLAVARGLDNLRIVLDRNNMQVDGQMVSVLPIGDVGEKLRAFGLDVREHDAHDIEGLLAALQKTGGSDQPAVLVSQSRPWTGFSFLEARWHDQKLHFVRLTPEEKGVLEKEVQALWQSS
ncbi:MAG: 1-deoxy-D-xylulose-5-phosphate synthase N-terminal domain-containing protein [Pontimonas sp.]